jgi:beta-phosphoglucomutase
MIQAIFFDFNGVIINDERIHLDAYRRVLTAENVPLTDEDYFTSLGMDDVAFVRAAYQRAGQLLTNEKCRSLIKQEHQLHRETIARDLPVPPGAVNFIKAAARSFQLGVVSMAERSEIDHVLNLAGLADQFTIIVSADPSLEHKPAPDCYRRGLALMNQQRRDNRQLPLLPRECLAIEDAPPGVAAARAAGMRTLALTTTVSEADLRSAGAEIITPYFSDLNVDAVHQLFD